MLVGQHHAKAGARQLLGAGAAGRAGADNEHIAGGGGQGHGSWQKPAILGRHWIIYRGMAIAAALIAVKPVS
jgi:hypothetical protein